MLSMKVDLDEVSQMGEKNIIMLYFYKFRIQVNRSYTSSAACGCGEFSMHCKTVFIHSLKLTYLELASTDLYCGLAVGGSLLTSEVGSSSEAGGPQRRGLLRNVCTDIELYASRRLFYRYMSKCGWLWMFGDVEEKRPLVSDEGWAKTNLINSVGLLILIGLTSHRIACDVRDF